jgi:hypothetical protein
MVLIKDDDAVAPPGTGTGTGTVEDEEAAIYCTLSVKI